MNVEKECQIIYKCSRCGEKTQGEFSARWNEDETLSCSDCGRKSSFTHRYQGKANTYAFKEDNK